MMANRSNSKPGEQNHAPVEGLLRRLRWTVLRPLATRLGGDERSLFLGPGVEVDEMREYEPGDDVRMIDWNVSARQGTPYVRQAFTQRSLDVWMVLDLSASIDWGTAQCLKRDRALEFAAVTGETFDRSRHHVGALLFAERPIGFIPPAAGRMHLMRIMDAIYNQPRQARRGRTDLRAALDQLNQVAKKRALVIVLSDFLVKNGWQAALGQAARRHEVVAARLVDPREGELPDVGMVTLEDPETGGQMIVNLSDRGLRERYRAAALEQSARIRDEVTAQRAGFFELSTGEDLLPALLRFLEDRKRQAQLMQRGVAK